VSTISSWLLSIAGIVDLSVLTEFVLPDGQINKYVKVVFSFIVLLVIILPIPKLLKSDFNLSQFMGEEVGLQEDYLEQINLNKVTALTEEINSKIVGSGLKNVEVAINSNIFAEKLEIYGISVDLREMIYAENFENKNISSAKEKIIQIIRSMSIFDGVEVKFYE